MANSGIKFTIETDASGAITAIRQYQSAVSAVGPAASTAAAESTTAFERMEKIIGKARSAIIGLASAFVFAEAIRGLKSIIDAGIEFEDTFSGIRKTVDGTAQDFEMLADAMLNLSKRIPINVNELNKIGEIAGQLGVKTADIGAFTETIAKMGSVTTLTTEEAATGFARLGTILRLSNSDVKVLASEIFSLGKSSNATEQEILSFALKLALAGDTLGLTKEDILAFSTALASTGLHAEKAGSAITKIMLDMARAVATGGDKLDKFSKVALGATASGEQFATVFKKSAADAMLKFLGGLDNIKKSGDSVILTLDALGLKNIRTEEVTLGATSAMKAFKDATALVADEAGRAGATLDEGFAKKMDTAKSQLEIVENRIHAVVIALSNEFKPSVVAAGKSLADFTEFLQEHNTLVKSAAEVLASMGLAFAGLKLATWASELGAVKNAVFLLVSALEDVPSAIAAIKLAFGSLGVISLLTADIALAINAVNKWNTATDDLKGIQDAHKQAIDSYTATVMGSVKVLRDHGIAIATEGRDIDSIANSVRLLQPELKAAVAATAAHTKASQDHSNQLREETKEQKKYREEIEKIKSPITDFDKDAKQLNTAIVEMMNSGVSAHTILGLFGKKLDDTADKARLLGRSLRSTTESLVDMQALLKLVDMKPGEIGNFGGQPIHYTPDTGFGTAPDVIGSQASQNEMIAESMKGLGVLRGATAAHVDVDIAISDASKKRMDDFRNSMVDAFDQLFKKVLQKGQLTWKDIAAFAAKAFDGLADMIFKPLANNLASIFGPTGAIGKQIQSFIGTGINGDYGKVGKYGGAIISGGAAVGGAVGGVAGSISGGAMGVATALMLAPGPTQWAGVAIAGAIAVGAAVSTMFGKMRKEADKFVKDVQNPFGDAVKGLFDGLSKAKDMGTLTVTQVQQGKDQFESMWTDFQARASAAGVVGQQAMATMTPFVASWREWLDSLEVAGRELERQAAIKSTVAKVSVDTSGVDIMENALQRLTESGMDWGPIIAILGGDMENLAANFKVFGMSLPPIFQAVLDQKRANEEAKAATDEATAAEKALVKARQDSVTSTINKVANAASGFDALNEGIVKLQGYGFTASQILHFLGGDIVNMGEAMLALGYNMPPALKALYDMATAAKRIAEIDDEIQNVGKQLGDALIQKMDFLDNALKKSQQNVADWQDKIKGLDKDIKDQTAHLADAKFWQKEYDDAIKDSADTLQKATDKRESIEKQIADLTLQTERDRLQSAVDNAFGPRAKEDAQKNLDAFESGIKRNEAADRIKQLNEMRIELQKTIKDQEAAQQAYTDAQVAAKEHINEMRAETAEKIANMQSERATLLENIRLEKIHIADIEKDMKDTQVWMDKLGVQRKDEFTKINDTIMALQARGIALKAERDSLIDIAGAASNATAAINGIFSGIMDTAGATPANRAPKTAAVEVSTPTTAAAPITPQATASHEPPSGMEPATPLRSARPYWDDPLGRRYAPRYEYGGMVPRDGLIYAHAGEKVTSSWKVRNENSNNKQQVIMKQGDVHVHISVQGNMVGNKEFAKSIKDEIVRGIDYGGVRFPASKVNR